MPVLLQMHDGEQRPGVHPAVRVEEPLLQVRGLVEVEADEAHPIPHEHPEEDFGKQQPARRHVEGRIELRFVLPNAQIGHAHPQPQETPRCQVSGQHARYFHGPGGTEGGVKAFFCSRAGEDENGGEASR